VNEKFEIVKGYYDSGLWDLSRVRNAVGRWITEEEYGLITGQEHGEEATTWATNHTG
jgi:hypothetical protein